MNPVKFDVIKHSKVYLFIIIGIVIAGIIGLVVRGGFSMDIDFTGGTDLSYDLGQDFESTDEIRAIVEGATVDKVVSSVQQLGGSKNQVRVVTKTLDTDQRENVLVKLKEKYPNVVQLSAQNFSEKRGTEISRDALIATILAIIGMLIYIAIRFELLTGIAAIGSLVHDVIVMFAVYAIFDIAINMSFVAAILTVIGYSINDTIIIFDRIRENTKKLTKLSFDEIANRSIWETMSRSINTVLTTLITITVLYIMGVTSVKEFAFPLIIGIASGCYSSIFVASPIWAWLRSKQAESRKKAKEQAKVGAKSKA